MVGAVQAVRVAPAVLAAQVVPVGRAAQGPEVPAGQAGQVPGALAGRAGLPSSEERIDQLISFTRQRSDIYDADSRVTTSSTSSDSRKAACKHARLVAARLMNQSYCKIKL